MRRRLKVWDSGFKRIQDSKRFRIQDSEGFKIQKISSPSREMASAGTGFRTQKESGFKRIWDSRIRREMFSLLR
jgi:hypothetical protein